MSCYINCISVYSQLSIGIKELIPDMNMRRRMSRVMKMGVTTGMESLAKFGERAPIDAIITATGLGCIADSEKFLDNLISQEEQLLTPTPFIQSTFNTIGGQIALLKKYHAYNMTYSHRETSFESALIDAFLQLHTKEARAVLLGAFDEMTPSVTLILEKLRRGVNKCTQENALFMVLTQERFDTSVAEITNIRFENFESEHPIWFLSQRMGNDSFTGISGVMASAIEECSGQKIALVNDLLGEKRSLIELICF